MYQNRRYMCTFILTLIVQIELLMPAYEISER